MLSLLSSVTVFAQSKNWHDDAVFGMHFDLHASSGDTVLGKSLTHENLREFLLKVKPDWIQCDAKGHPGYTSFPTKVGTPSPGIVKDALRIHRDVTKELGIKLGVHYSGVWDIVAVEKHPQWQCRNAKGEPYGNTCLLSDYQKELEIPQMLEMVRDYDIDGFWVDGECWALNLCYCDRCRAEFNKRTGIETPPTDKNDPNWYAWSSFHRDLFYEYVERYTKAIHELKPECLVVSNWLYSYGHPSKEIVDTDYISGDLSPIKAIKSAMLEGSFIPNRTKDWDLMVWSFTHTDNGPGQWIIKSPDRLIQECAYISACGGSSMVYDQPQRDGIITNWHADIFAKVSDFIKQRKILRNTQHIKEAVILNDEEWFYNRYNSILIDVNAYPNITGAGQILSELHIPINIAATYMVEDNLDDYGLVVVPEITLNDNFKKKLLNYVSNGGKVILTGSLVYDGFSDFLGVEKIGRYDDSSNFWVATGDRVASFNAPMERVNTTTAKTFRYRMWQQQPGLNESSEPIITINKIGKGFVTGIYTDIFQQFDANQISQYKGLIQDVVKEMGCKFSIRDVQAPSYVHVIAREKPGMKIISLMNTGQVKAQMAGDFDTQEVPVVKEVKFSMDLPQKPKSVTLMPSGKNIKSSWKDGVLSVTVKNLHILESVIIK